LGFLKRILPPKASLSIAIDDKIVADVHRHYKGMVQLKCEEALKVEQIHLEVSVDERYRKRRRDNKGKVYYYDAYHNHFYNNVVFSWDFEAAAAYMGEYKFDVEVPRPAPQYGGTIITSLKAETKVKERLDFSTVVYPFSAGEEDELFNRWLDGSRDGAKVQVAEDKLKGITLKVKENDFDWLKTNSSLPSTDVSRLMVDSGYKAGYFRGLSSRIPKELVSVEVHNLDGFEKKMRL